MEDHQYTACTLVVYTVPAQSGWQTSEPMTLLMSIPLKVLMKFDCSFGAHVGLPVGDGMFHG